CPTSSPSLTSMFPWLGQLLGDVYRFHVRSIKTALDKWRLQADRSFPIALLWFFTTFICNDMNFVLRAYGYFEYILHRRKHGNHIVLCNFYSGSEFTQFYYVLI